MKNIDFLKHLVEEVWSGDQDSLRQSNSSVIGHKDVREDWDVSRTIGNLHDDLEHEIKNFNN